MKKLKIIALAAAIALIFSGCSMFSVNEDRIKTQTVATVNGVKITRQQVELEAEQSEEYQSNRRQYGFTVKDLTENEHLNAWYKDLLSRTLDQMVVYELLAQKAPELGVALTDEEKQEQRDAADETFKNVKDMARSQVKQELTPSPSPDVSTSPEAGTSPEASASPEASTSPEASASPEASTSPEAGTSPEASAAPGVSTPPEASPTPEASPSPTATIDPEVEAAVEKRYQEILAELPFNPDTYYDYLCKQKLVEKVKEHIKGLAEVTDEDVSTWYNESVTAQQAEMDADPAQFATKMNGNKICVYVPEDTVAVKHVLITFKDQDLAEVAKQLYTDGETDKAMELLKGQIDELMPTMPDIQQRLENGESIDSLIDEFGEDPGMTSGTTATLGYLVGPSTTSYVKEFSDAALKLTAVGDVSDPVATYYGLHVLQVIKIYKKGVVPFDDIKDAIKTALLPTKQQQKFDELVEQWKSESKITYDKGRLNN
jgi:parvulin-like peptidyl-prolyl isomerase